MVNSSFLFPYRLPYRVVAFRTSTETHTVSGLWTPGAGTSEIQQNTVRQSRRDAHVHAHPHVDATATCSKGKGKSREDNINYNT